MPLSAYIFTFLAIGLWSLLAYIGSSLQHLPALLVTGVSLCIGGIMGLPGLTKWRAPWQTMLIGICGLSGYHLLFFSAFKFAPAVQTNLINYLWPLLIVLLSPLFFRECRITWRHFAAGLLGFSGTALIITGGTLAFDLSGITGYMLSAAAAFVWATYSLLTKKVSPFPTAAVGGFCLSSGILSLLIFAIMDGHSFSPSSITAREWTHLILSGVGPMGLAFYSWDMALKKGDPRTIGALSYLTPLLSTINLAVLGNQTLSTHNAAAMVLIIAGAVIGTQQKSFKSHS